MLFTAAEGLLEATLWRDSQPDACQQISSNKNAIEFQHDAVHAEGARTDCSPSSIIYSSRGFIKLIHLLDTTNPAEATLAAAA